ncbi:two-component sensor histidine kinase [Bacteroidia bacterium]|nr:two-component sensor histidine kinase [Bacteroidia bacterium]
MKKENKRAGVIIISAKGSLDDKIKGIHIGADDYLPKPFHLSELSVRIYALIRRTQYGSNNYVQSNNLKIDLLSKEVVVNGEEVVLTKKEFDLLLFLIGNKNRVISKNALAEHLSGDMADMLDNPAYYFFYNEHYVHEIDEFLLLSKEKIYRKSLKTLKISEIPVWNQYNDDEEIIPDNGQENENVYFSAKFYNEREAADEDYRILYSRVKIEDKNYILVIRLSTFEAKKIILSGTLLQLAFFFFLLLGFVFITHLIYKKLWKPFYQTLSDIERFNIRNNDVPAFTQSETQEFHQLNKAVENLISNNLQAYKTQKEFTENASHEMQTPLAVFQSKLDMLIQQPDLTEGQLSIIQSLYDTTSRLTRMNKNLLLLAKIDNLQFENTQSLAIAGILNELLPFLLEQAEVNHIEIQTDIAGETDWVQANKTLLESLVNNLFVNAVKHNIPCGKIHILLDDKQLSISNTGNAAGLDENLLFRRFSRMNEKAKGNGLGLAIAKQICSLYGWDIRYAYENEEHRFTVTFHEQSTEI